jgi:hypothetical protein
MTTNAERQMADAQNSITRRLTAILFLAAILPEDGRDQLRR